VTIWQLSFAQDLDTCRPLVQRCEALLAHPSLAYRDTRREQAAFALQLASPSAWLIDRSHAYAERALALCRDLGDRAGMASAQSALGLHAWIAGDYEEARKWYQLEFELSRARDHPSGQIGAIGWMIMVAISQGHVEECERRLREFHAMVGSSTQNSMMVWDLWLLGGTHVAAGQYGQAEAELEECAAILRERGQRVGLSRMLCHLCEAKMHLGRFEEAREQAQEAIPLAREGAQPGGEDAALTTLGAVALGEGQPIVAMEWLQQAVTMGRAGNFRTFLVQALGYAGHAARRSGQTAQARGYLVDALRMGIAIRSFRGVWIALPAVALLLADRGQAERATELYALAWSVPHIAHSRWYEDVAGRELAAAATALPAEVRVAAQARGRARDLWATAQKLLEELQEEGA